MRKVGEVPWGFASYNTCQHRGRVFHFSQKGGNLLVTEVILGDEVECIEVQTGVECKTASDLLIACCSFGDRILVMAGGDGDAFAALVDVGEGRLRKEAVHITTLTVRGDKEWPGWPYLCQVGENRALLFFHPQSNMWYCDVAGDTLNMRKLGTQMPTVPGFRTLPIRLPDGKLLVAGTYLVSTDITLISCNEEPQFEKIGDIPGESRWGAPSILFRNRFVVGFGGNYGNLDDLWIFDLRTRRSSIVWEKGEWARPAELPALTLQGDTLYIIKNQVHSITFHALSELIDDDKVRDAFCDEFGLPRVPRYEPPLVAPGSPDKVFRTRSLFPCSSNNTLLCNGKILHFSSREGKLLVSELLFYGTRRKFVQVSTEVECNPGSLGCCLIGDQILVMSGKSKAVSAALVTVDEGRMSEKAIHFTALTVAGGTEWGSSPYLCQVSEKRVLLHFGGENDMWYCDVEGDKLTVCKTASKTPTERGFGCLPIRLPNGRLLVAGSRPYSTDIRQIECNKDPLCEKIGNIPGVERTGVMMILVAKRFVLGFGGYNGSRLDDLWIFDLQTRRASIVWEADDWVEKTGNAVLFLRDGRLWILGQKLGIIPLSILSERIDDNEIRKAFCKALSLPPAPRYSPPPPVAIASSGMTKINGTVAARSYNTVQHRGRVFHFSLSGNELLVSEVIFYGRRAKMLTAHTGATLGGRTIGCCLLGNRILVMSGRKSSKKEESDTGSQGEKGASSSEEFEVFAALVNVGAGRLSKEAVHITPLTVSGDVTWPATPFLCQVSKNRALLYFHGQDSMWYCDIAGTKLTMKKLTTWMPTERGFVTAPIPVSDGKLLVAGADPDSTDITLISCDGEPRFERVGSIPGEAREGCSSILIGERFVVGFGGYHDGGLDDLWIFDLQTREGSQVKKEGEWHPDDWVVPLVIQNNTLYLFGRTTNAITLSALSDLVEDEEIKTAFKQSLASPPPPQTLLGESHSAGEDSSDSHLPSVEEQSDAVSSANLPVQTPAGELPRLDLQAELREAREEIAALKAENQRLRDELDRIAPPPCTIQIHLPFKDLPALPLPQKWSISSEALQKTVEEMERHQKKLSPKHSFLREYKEAFAPFLSEGLPQVILSVQSSVPASVARNSLVAHVSHSISPGHLVPLNTGLPSLAKLAPLRLEEKLLDSEASRQAKLIASDVIRLTSSVSKQTPPTYNSIVTLLDSSDPLRVDSTHRTTGLLRRSIHFSAAAKKAERARTLTEVVRFLQRLERMSRGRYGSSDSIIPVPWLDRREKPQPSLRSRKGERAEKSEGTERKQTPGTGSPG